MITMALAGAGNLPIEVSLFANAGLLPIPCTIFVPRVGWPGRPFLIGRCCKMFQGLGPNLVMQAGSRSPEPSQCRDSSHLDGIHRPQQKEPSREKPLVAPSLSLQPGSTGGTGGGSFDLAWKDPFRSKHVQKAKLFAKSTSGQIFQGLIYQGVPFHLRECPPRRQDPGQSPGTRGSRSPQRGSPYV